MKAILKTLSVLSLLSLLAGCAHDRANTAQETSAAEQRAIRVTNEMDSKTVEASPQYSRTVKVEFNKGGSLLKQASKAEISTLVQNASKFGKIGEIEVLAWGDSDPVLKGKKATRAEIKLADDRAAAVKTYIKDELLISSVDSHNMAKNPSAVSKIFKTDDYYLKSTASERISAPQNAVVLLRMEKDSRH